MTPHANLSGTSGIRHFAIGLDYIEVVFANRAIYKYSRGISGQFHVERMKELAIAGRGLGAYIKRNVNKAFESKRFASFTEVPMYY